MPLGGTDRLTPILNWGQMCRGDLDRIMGTLACYPALWALLPWNKRFALVDKYPMVLMGGCPSADSWQKGWLPFGLPPPVRAPPQLTGNAWCRFLLGIGYRPSMAWGYGSPEPFRCAPLHSVRRTDTHRGYAGLDNKHQMVLLDSM